MNLSLLITKSSSETKNIQLIPLCLIRLFAFCMKILIHLPIQCQCYPQIQTSHLICCANQLIGFCMRTTLAFNELSALWSLFSFYAGASSIQSLVVNCTTLIQWLIFYWCSYQCQIKFVKECCKMIIGASLLQLPPWDSRKCKAPEAQNLHPCSSVSIAEFEFHMNI